MKKSLKVLLLSGVTLLMVACMDSQEEPTTEVSSVETTELVEESVESEVESVESVEEESLSEDISSESSDEESEVTSEDSSESSESEETTSEEMADDQSSASDDVESTESEASEDADSSESSESESTESDEADTSDEEVEAVAEIEPVVVDMINKDGDSVGTATFEEAANGVILTLELEGLEAGEYGFHIHEYGKATAPTFMDALGHFNPTGANHGIHAEGGPHIGDFPNLIVGKDGKVNIVLVVSNVSLDPEAPYTLRTENGTSLIIHEGPDDYETQPIGTAGYGMIGGVIFAPMSEEAPATEDETSEESSESESSDDASTDSESSETDKSDTESSNTSSDDEAKESESKSEE